MIPRTPAALRIVPGAKHRRGRRGGARGGGMPDMFAHYTVAEAARQSLPDGPLARLLAAEHDAYKVGAQGPDFLFYSGVRPWQRGSQRPRQAPASARDERGLPQHAGSRGRPAGGGAGDRLLVRLRLRGPPLPGRRRPPVGALLDRRHQRRRPGSDESALAPEPRAARGLHRRHAPARASSAHDWLRRQGLLRMSGLRRRSWRRCSSTCSPTSTASRSPPRRAVPRSATWRSSTAR